MGNLSIKKNKTTDAIAFFNQAIELTDTNDDKANSFMVYLQLISSRVTTLQPETMHLKH